MPIYRDYAISGKGKPQAVSPFSFGTMVNDVDSEEGKKQSAYNPKWFENLRVFRDISLKTLGGKAKLTFSSIVLISGHKPYFAGFKVYFPVAVLG